MNHPIDNKQTGRTYWASFEHLASSPEIAEAVDKEFASYDPKDVLTVPRRRFLKYVAASMALAGVGLGGCRRWPKEVIAPYAHEPKDHTPGIPEFYATSYELGGVGVGLLAESFDGRPIKIEGNPNHPGSVTRSGNWGSADAIAQAQTLSLYDPDRSRAVVDRPNGQAHPVDWFTRNVIPRFQAFKGRGGRMAVLCEASASPTLLRLRQQLENDFAGTTWYTWEPLRATSQADATTAAFGKPLRPVYHLDKAAVVVSLDEDYLGLHPAHVRYAADWSKRRASVDRGAASFGAVADDGEVSMSKCFTAESRYSLTGASGDYRLPVSPSRLALVAAAMGRAIGLGSASDLADDLTPREQAFVDQSVAAIRANPGKALVCFGAHLPVAVQSLLMAVNDEIGAVGSTLTYVEDPVPPAGDIAELTRRMADGELDALLILGGNPVYDAPADLDFATALANVRESVHLSLYDDETSARCTYHVPRAHFLEAWGDTRGWDGTVAPVQPIILPLYNGLSSIEVLANLLGLPATDGLTLVRDTLRPMLDESQSETYNDVAFRRVLHDGVVAGTALPPVEVGRLAVDTLDLPRPRLAANQLEVVFAGDGHLYDGRFANNGWLQEMPDTMSKLTWDNAALMSIHDAERIGVETGDVVTLGVPGLEPLNIAVYVMPGQPRGCVALPLGYGRTRAGNIGNSNDGEGGGFDTYKLRATGGLWNAVADVAKQGQRYMLAMTQNHHLIDKVGYQGREDRVGGKGQTSTVIRETSFPEHLAYLATHPAPIRGVAHGYPADKKAHASVALQLFNPPAPLAEGQDESRVAPHAWGMTIDMNLCIGCTACAVACQAENNIPVVGKEQVANNREMHWLRVDRYFKAEGETYEEKIFDDNPDVALQPMMCVHCENAPCEQVCPVAATVHDTQGLNVMIYNRCIGTRYCSNNCPYKVRRFNYLDWHVKDPRGSMLTAVYPGIPDQQQHQIDAVKRMVYNPDVTVRMRGVMEKCTYCTQRIQVKTIWRSNRGEPLQDGDIKTACQTACPTEAIVFGDLKDRDARVTQQQRVPRGYDVLAELNTRPRTRYLARLRNRDEDAVGLHDDGDDHHIDAAPHTEDAH